MTKSCRTCAYLRVPPDKDGKARRRANTAYRCLAPIPIEPHDMPESVTRGYDYRWPTDRSKSRVEVDMGEQCGAWMRKADA